MYDMIVIGGGPAGMTAALYALRNGKTVLVLEKHGFGGQITHSPKVENYPGTIQMSGNEFADRFLEQILHQGADVELERAISVKTEGDLRIVETEEGGTYEALTVVIATGVKHRMLGLEGENELVGEGISFCAVCDGDFYTDQTVCVAGGGNSALQEAILLAEKCKEVIILQDLPARLQGLILPCFQIRLFDLCDLITKGLHFAKLLAFIHRHPLNLFAQIGNCFKFKGILPSQCAVFCKLIQKHQVIRLIKQGG